MLAIDIDEALTPIAREMSHRADDILELRDAARFRSDPGRCLSCYFKLLSNSTQSSAKAATPLRRWLEQHLEVVAKDGYMRELERVPLSLDADEIEEYCQQIITTFQEDRSYQHISDIELSFQFRQDAAFAG